MISLITAWDDNYTIGTQDGSLPWKHFPADMRFFQKQTMGKQLLIGRVTYNSLPKSMRMCDKRRFIVCTRSNVAPNIRPGVDMTISDPVSYIQSLHSQREALENIMLIGGGQLYGCMLDANLVSTAYVTHVHGTFDGSVQFPNPEKVTSWNMKSCTKFRNAKQPYHADFMFFER